MERDIKERTDESADPVESGAAGIAGPGRWRTAFAEFEAGARDVDGAGNEAGVLDIVLTYPTLLHELAAALRSARSGAVVPLASDQRSDQALFQAWKGADHGAFRELDRRYRPRILSLATSMKFSAEDAEEIVQETLLGLFLRRETFRHLSTPDDVICDLTATSFGARLRGERRRTRLQSVLVHSTAADRSERECRGQPNEGLLASDLASQVNILVRKLPVWCRRVVRLRAMEGQSAKEVGATLDMPPSTVNMWLLHARRFMAGELYSHAL